VAKEATGECTCLPSDGGPTGELVCLPTLSEVSLENVLAVGPLTKEHAQVSPLTEKTLENVLVSPLTLSADPSLG